MKVCLLNDSFPPVIDGVANVVVNYAKELTAMHVDTAVGTPYYPNEDYSKYPFQVVTYPSLDASLVASGYRAGYPFPIKELARLAEFEPDVIHTHCPINSIMIARSLRDVTRAPVILTYHTKYDIDIRKALGDNILAEESIKALVHNVNSCDEVWAVSQGAKENLHSLGYTGECRVVLNGVDFPRGIVNGPEADAYLAKYDLPSDVPVFLFVGRLMNYKGLPMIIDALHTLSVQGRGYRMMIAGDGADRNALIRQIKHTGIRLDMYKDDTVQRENSDSSLAGKIIMAGPVSDRLKLRMINSRADLFIFPSTFDTNGLVVREAAACGLASVLIKNSCAAEGITDGRNGFLIDENAESLAAFLSDACDHRDQLKQAGEHAMQEIYISWSDAVHTAYDLYGQLLEKKQNGTMAERMKLGDDPLYDMTGDAIRQYIYNVHTVFPHYEGMMDNFIERTQSIRDDIAGTIQDIFSRK